MEDEYEEYVTLYTETMPILEFLFEIKGVKVDFLFHPADPRREVYREFPPSYDIFRRWCQGLFRSGVPHMTLAYTSQLLTLHQHRADNQYRTANQI